MDTNASVLSYEMNKINVDAKWREQVEAQKEEIERLQSEIDCEERRFNHLTLEFTGWPQFGQSA